MLNLIAPSTAGAESLFALKRDDRPSSPSALSCWMVVALWPACSEGGLCGRSRRAATARRGAGCAAVPCRRQARSAATDLEFRLRPVETAAPMTGRAQRVFGGAGASSTSGSPSCRRSRQDGGPRDGCSHADVRGGPGVRRCRARADGCGSGDMNLHSGGGGSHRAAFGELPPLLAGPMLRAHQPKDDFLPGRRIATGRWFTLLLSQSVASVVSRPHVDDLPAGCLLHGHQVGGIPP
ncbi:hypothetical protein FQR65_LT20459 [Abscondita terminalis]|nr:hypothetical protein FQR65_LT20459 [Abscondita terminalis]